jgi:cytochrome c biogenesis protein CcdA
VSVAIVVLAALADGVNPCAFAAMVLLVSILSTVRLADGGERTTVAGLALGGGAMCLGVFVTYYAAGLALFAGAGFVESYPLAERIVFWSVWALAAVGFVLSSVDAALYLRTGDAKRVLLRIPEPLRRKLAPLIRTGFGRGGLALGGFAGGVIIALVEGVCTGQMLLPTIQYMASTPGLRARGALYLLLYNALFTLPLAVILAVAIAGVRFQALSGFLKRHLAAAKVLLAAVFLALATAMLAGRLL